MTMEVVHETGALARTQDTRLSEEQIALIKRTIAEGTTDDELSLFIQQCNRTQLDPFNRQIYCIGRYNRRANRKIFQTQVSIDGARLVAQRSREYEGQTAVLWTADGVQWVDVWLSEEPPKAAKVGTYRTGFREAMTAVATWKEYAVWEKNAQGEAYLGAMWKKMPALMLGKVAEMLSLRRAFPMELSGLYSTEEMGQADNDAAPPAPAGAGAAGTTEEKTTRTRKPPERRARPPAEDQAPAPAQAAPEDEGIEDAEIVDETLPGPNCIQCGQPVLGHGFDHEPVQEGDEVVASADAASIAEEVAALDIRDLTAELEKHGLSVAGTTAAKRHRLIECLLGVAPAQLDPNKIRQDQMITLQGSFKGYARDDRIDAVNDILPEGRTIESFTELTESEADELIRVMK